MTNLITRLQTTPTGTRELDAEIAEAVLGGEVIWQQANYTMEMYPVRKYPSTMHVDGYSREPVLHYTTTIDAALTLIPEGWSWKLVYEPEYTAQGPRYCVVLRNAPKLEHVAPSVVCSAPTPALALITGILKARTQCTTSQP